MTEQIARYEARPEAAEIAERVLLAGDLSRLTPEERVRYYNETCVSLGLNPLTAPFAYITLNNKLTLYARKDATDQLRRLHNVTLTIVSRERIEDLYLVTVRATLPGGRSDEEMGAVAIGNLKGDLLCNAILKAITKAKRRATLSIVGLGWLDETEVETIPAARAVSVNKETGEMLNAPESPEKALLRQSTEPSPPKVGREQIVAKYAEWLEKAAALDAVRSEGDVFLRLARVDVLITEPEALKAHCAELKALVARLEKDRAEYAEAKLDLEMDAAAGRDPFAQEVGA